MGEYSHNLVRKVRWAFNPTPGIADNLKHPWFEDRKQAWVQTCTLCHSESFAKAYLDTADKGTIQGLKVEQEAKSVIKALYKDGLLTGQNTNRPAPPAPAHRAGHGAHAFGGDLGVDAGIAGDPFQSFRPLCFRAPGHDLPRQSRLRHQPQTHSGPGSFR